MLITRNNPILDASQTIARFQAITARRERAEQVAVSGIAVERPSDAAGRWELIHAIRAALSDQQRWQRGMDMAEDMLLTADGVFDTASNALQSAIALAIQFASETYDAPERAAAAPSITAIRDDLLAVANTRVGDRYIFAGDDFHGAAFDASGAYLGSAASSAVQIGDGVDVQSVIDGSSVFASSSNVFGVLNDLVTALQTNDTAAIAATIDPLRQAAAQVAQSWSEVGYRLDRISDARVLASSLELVMQERLETNTGADMPEAFTNLTLLQTTYEAALQVTASASSGARLFNLI
jgi:flagellar hook-associated protein 3 FlgL